VTGMITPADSPSSPSNYEAVTPHGQGPAPYNIQAEQQDLTGLVNAAGALAGAGIVYPMGPRQSETEVMLSSPQGFALQGYDIDAGYGGTWGTDMEPDVQGP